MSPKIPEWLRQAREKWQYYGQERPHFAIPPKTGQRSVWDFPRPPALEKVSKTLMVKWHDTTIAFSQKALAVLETASPPTYYIPLDDVKQELLIALPHKKSLCEWKGSAIYWALRAHQDRPVAWSYPKPFDDYFALKDHLAFYPQLLECYVDDERVRPQPGAFYAGWITDELVGPFKGEPGTGHW